MNASQLKSYRPVSNLPFLSKLLEIAIYSQLQAFIDANSASPAHQSAYRKHHSSQAALIKVYDDLLKDIDNGQMSALSFLDLTAAFDTVDHELLLARLERTIGVWCHVLAWLRSYLTGRTYCVIYAGASSAIKEMTCSVPHGSVLGPLLFSLYTADLADLAAMHGVTLYAFADDTQ